VTPVPEGLDPVPPAPDEVPPPSLVFFRPDEAELVEAITARIIPGDPDDPGAREAGVVYYIDRLLANGDGFAEPTYRQPPFAQSYAEGEEPPVTPEVAQPAFIWVAADQLERYGFQSPMTPREAYQNGLAAVSRLADARFGSAFVDLDEEQQDELLMAMDDGEAEGFEEPSAPDFFEMLRTHTIEGMFSDPLYGGNRDMVGWRLVGFPGAQRGYTAGQMKEEGYRREPQGLAGLPHFHAGRPDPAPVLPVRGNEERRAGR
jgi:gluconate 2-dehydrogenase gamma chain